MTEAALAPSGPVTLGNLTVNPDNYRVSVGDNIIDLSVREFDLLQIMIAHVDRILPYSQLAESLWDDCDRRRLRNLNVQIYRLRQKLGQSSPFVIKTVRSKGYGLIDQRPHPARPASGATE